MIKFSVVIPTYNRAELLLETLDSILSQTYPVNEIIVIDDGSSDDTQAQVAALNHPLIRYIKQDNTGQNIARHNGVLKANYTWVALCDSDDLWTPDHIARLADLIEFYPSCDFVFSNFSEFGNSSRYLDKFASAPIHWQTSSFYQTQDDFRLYDGELFYQLLDFTPIFPSTLAFKKEKYIAYNAISANLKGQNLGAEDFYTTLMFAAKGILASDSKITAKIRKHDENHSGSNLKNMEGEILIIEEIYRQLNQDGINNIQFAKIEPSIQWRLNALAYHYFQNKDKANFNRVYHRLPFNFKLFFKKYALKWMA
ncbi:glycosyltransferase family 2 protein [Catenovulum adriaticum]|uniref:Glycosyltransferase n=1 Tax=Catenovulum adriaticum TaxID=2984846 RepID=A0ABY7AMH2_9ALTE|nr:glycosyltransferase family 2 protein [Catenovulum sp. TS8]WAJ70689.1 glycosyltransferase [Catenovulum sp. TS8]